MIKINVAGYTSTILRVLLVKTRQKLLSDMLTIHKICIED